MSKAVAAIISGSVGVVWAVLFGYSWYLWMSGAFRLRTRLYAQGHGAGTLRLGRLYVYARTEDPRSPEAARFLRGMRGILLACGLLIALMIVIMIAAGTRT